jgi:hypothetical protein
MQQRQYRPGDVLDDYCPRERRVTDHAIVAMVESEIQRTRCVVCDAEHEFKNARVPTPRKKGTTAALFSQVLDNIEAPPGRPSAPAPTEPSPPLDAAAPADTPETSPDVPDVPSIPAAFADDCAPADASEDRPFRRSLIRAQLPRPEGQAPPTRAIPEFTMHQPLNQRARRGGRFRRHPGGAPEFGGPRRSGRPGGPVHGNSAGNGQGSGRRRRRKKH